MSQALYRTYRSKSLDEVVGQDHITTPLKHAIKSGKIAHAYLLTGSRGTGKTSVARILAHEVNDFDYDEPCRHLDIIEIDAASNRRIDEVRDIREKVVIAPSQGKYKVYIIDEVHMLTKEAFNALLKTLEEPPEHAIFILATTELQKVPDTIISRTQRFTFKPIERQTIIDHLKYIAKMEDINVSDEALGLIADHARGGFRDAISLLDQVRHSTKNIEATDVEMSIGLPPEKLLSELYALLRSESDAREALMTIIDGGYQAGLIAKQLLKKALKDADVALAKKLIEVTRSSEAELELIMIALGTTQPLAIVAPPETKLNSKPASKPQKSTEVHNATEPTNKATKEENGFEIIWHKVLETIKSEGHAVYGPLRLAVATKEGSTLQLGLRFPFHIKRIQESANMQAIQSALRQHYDDNLTIQVDRIKVDTEPVETNQPSLQSMPPTVSEPNIALVKEVFGGAEPV